MFGNNFIVDLDFDSHELLYVINDLLKEKGISYINTMDEKKLRGYGDAGMGIFEMEKKIDRDKNFKLHVETNSQISSEILKNLIDMALEHIEENNLYIRQEEEIKETEKEISEKKVCSHEYKLIREEEFMGIDLNVYLCSNCNKLEFYKK